MLLATNASRTVPAPSPSPDHTGRPTRPIRSAIIAAVPGGSAAVPGVRVHGAGTTSPDMTTAHRCSVVIEGARATVTTGFDLELRDPSSALSGMVSG